MQTDIQEVRQAMWNALQSSTTGRHRAVEVKYRKQSVFKYCEQSPKWEQSSRGFITKDKKYVITYFPNAEFCRIGYNY